MKKTRILSSTTIARQYEKTVEDEKFKELLSKLIETGGFYELTSTTLISMIYMLSV